MALGELRREVHVERLIARLKALHTYDVPCIEAIPIATGYAPYLDWVHTETAAAHP